jgi:hypothetical protein
VYAQRAAGQLATCTNFDDGVVHSDIHKVTLECFGVEGVGLDGRAARSTCLGERLSSEGGNVLGPLLEGLPEEPLGQEHRQRHRPVQVALGSTLALGRKSEVEGGNPGLLGLAGFFGSFRGHRRRPLSGGLEDALRLHARLVDQALRDQMAIDLACHHPTAASDRRGRCALLDGKPFEGTGAKDTPAGDDAHVSLALSTSSAMAVMAVARAFARFARERSRSASSRALA